MKKLIIFMLAAAMLSAGVYAEPVVEAASAAAGEEEPVQPDEPPEHNIVVDGDYFPDIAVNGAAPVENDIAVEEPISDEDYFPEEGILPDEGDSVEPLPELGDIDKYLAENGYPAYLSFICNTGAAINGYDPTSGEKYQPQMTYWWDVGVVNATAAQKEEIQALIDELYPIENIVTFVDCTYSYEKREALLPEIRRTAEELFPTIKVIDVSLIRNTEQIALQLDFADDIEADMVREKMYAVYGDLLFMGDFGVTADDSHDIGGVPTAGIGAAPEIAEEEIYEAVEEEGIAVATNYDDGASAAPAVGDMTTSEEAYGGIAAIPSPAEQSNDNTVLWICIAAVLIIALGAAAFIYRAKLIPVFATSNGSTTAEKASKKQAEEAVKNSEVIPDDSLLQAIREKIDE